jgi:hypothetical protein
MADGQKVKATFIVDDKTYGWAFPTIRQQIAMASRREVLCMGQFDSMAKSTLVMQWTAANDAMMLVELEAYIVQYPEDEPVGFSHLTDREDIVKIYNALQESVKPFRDKGGSTGGGAEETEAGLVSGVVPPTLQPAAK